MDLHLEGKVALIAASSGGIGRATALQFAREGARVAVNGRDAATLRETAKQIRHETGAEVAEVVADVSTEEGCQRLVGETLQRFGSLYAVVTNSGGPPSKPFEDLTDEDWKAAADLLLLSAVRLTRLSLTHLRESTGSIAMITSLSVKQPIPGLVLSNSIRPGVTGLAKTLAEELAPEGVRVNCVAPGSVWTGRSEYLARARAERKGISFEQEKRRAEESLPMKRYGTPEDVGALVAFLSSPVAGYITGSTILVDGGAYLGLM